MQSMRGGMDASQYKDYVLFMLFIKYISDKYANSDDFAPPVIIPPGASFADMVALKGKSDIGDQINKKIVRPLEEANRLRIKADFNDDALLGQGKEKVDKLTLTNQDHAPRPFAVSQCGVEPDNHKHD